MNAKPVITAKAIVNNGSGSQTGDTTITGGLANKLLYVSGTGAAKVASSRSKVIAHVGSVALPSLYSSLPAHGLTTPNTNGYAWVLTMAKNLSINENKKINRSTPTDFQENEFVATSQDVDCDIPVFKIAKRVLTAEELTIVLLYSVNGYKHREIAKILDKPLGTVLWSYNNSLKKIKKAIGGLK